MSIVSDYKLYKEMDYKEGDLVDVVRGRFVL